MNHEISLELAQCVQISRDSTDEDATVCGSSGNASSTITPDGSEAVGKILPNSSLAWTSTGSLLEVFCVHSGSKVVSKNFDCCPKTKNCVIACVEAFETANRTLIAVGIILRNQSSLLVVLSTHGCREIGRIELPEAVQLLHWIREHSYAVGILGRYNGCLAVATIDGKMLLVDLCLRIERNEIFGTQIAMNGEGKMQCHIEFTNLETVLMAKNHEMTRQRGIYFGLQVLECEHDDITVESLLDIPPLMAMAIGYSDGSIRLFDLVDLRVFHRIPEPTADLCPVVAMNYIEPTEDPKACLYVWAFHAGDHRTPAFAVMHMVMCEEKYSDEGRHVYERFVSCSTRLRVSTYDRDSMPLSIQSIARTVPQEEEVITLCVLSWLTAGQRTTILVLDLNQWYKAEMPYECDWRAELTHTVVFHIQGESVDTRLKQQSLVPFASIQRPEEHFYPNSLSFEIITFSRKAFITYRWIGLQNKLLDYLNRHGANEIIEPTQLYHILYRAALIPQFFETQGLGSIVDETVTTARREIVLSLALEYNCHQFLHSCISLWADGSHMGANPDRGASLSTLTDWIWNRAKTLKSVCNEMCIPLFDLSGRRIDCGTQNTLSRCSRQLKQLAGLFNTILTEYQEYIPDNVVKKLQKECCSVSAAADYQEIIQWLLHVGILPEVANSAECSDLPDEFLLVPYPYNELNEYYQSHRKLLADDTDAGGTTAPCKHLFIDTLIAREFEPAFATKEWPNGSWQGLYPPESMQTLLRTLLLTGVSKVTKLTLLTYVFMDITAVLGDGRYGAIVSQLEKFPSVFHLKVGVIKRLQAFWYLDHGHVASAAEEFLSPLCLSADFPLWHRELAVATFLRLDAPHLALKVIRSPGLAVDPQLEMRTLIQCNLISDAFKVQRSHQDRQLLLAFFDDIVRFGKHETLLEFALTEQEKDTLREFLAEHSLPATDNLLFGHLLQNLDFVEAVHLVDRLGRRKQPSECLEAQKEILTLYHGALDPTSQRLAYLTYAEQRDLQHKPSMHAETLSASLIRGRCDFRNRIFHKSIVAIKEAANELEHAQPFLKKPDLGVFQYRPQVRSINVTYPVRVDLTMNKRKRAEYDEAAERGLISNEYANPKKRRHIDYAGDRVANGGMACPAYPEFSVMSPRYNFSTGGNDAKMSNVEDKLSDRSNASHSPTIMLSTPPVQKKRGFYSPPSPVSVSSYTPHGILKSTASVTSVSVAATRRSITPPTIPPVVAADPAIVEREEKLLRFDLPDSPCVMSGTEMPPLFSATDDTLLAPIVDLSTLSNEDFFSPDTSMVEVSNNIGAVVAGLGEPNGTNEMMKQLLSTGPKRRRSLHSRSRSTTPIDGNIAIIIEDIVEDATMVESSSNPEVVVAGPSPRKPLARLDSDTIIDDNVTEKENDLYKPVSTMDTDSSNDCIIETVIEDEGDDTLVDDDNADDNDDDDDDDAAMDCDIAEIVDDDDDEDDDVDDDDDDDDADDDNNDEDEIDDEDDDIQEIIDISSGEEENHDLPSGLSSSSSSSSSDDSSNKGNDDDKPSGSDTNLFKQQPEVSSINSDIILPPVRAEEHALLVACDIQVPTTSSTQETVSSVRRACDVEDLSVQQEQQEQAQTQTQEQAQQVMGEARDLSVAGERATEPFVASEAKLRRSSSRDDSFKGDAKGEDVYLGQLKNAHEVDVPAMNLSVKPDEAHCASRKNSKGEEMVPESTALNLSAGQQSDDESSDDEKLVVSESEDGTEPKPTVDSQKDEKNEAIESSRTPPRDNEASTSTTMRETVDTWNRAVLERGTETSPSTVGTPVKRVTRASSVAKETTDTSTPSPTLSRSRRYSSMDNVAVTPNSSTRRSSLRASSLAKELLTSTPIRKSTRRTSSTALATSESPSVQHDTSLADHSFDNSASEKSFQSNGSRRSARRRLGVGRPRKLSEQPSTITEEEQSQQSESAVTTDNQPHKFVDYSATRRLTRYQSAVIEKSLEIARSASMATSVDVGELGALESGHDSESESVVSHASSRSRRSTRSRASQRSTQTTPSKAGSVGTRRSKRKLPTAGGTGDSGSDQSFGLDVISEEGESSQMNVVDGIKRTDRNRKSRRGK